MDAIDIDHIRNFCIIAHIDHGKTTLSDRFLQFTNTIQAREMKDQLLDSMDLEREKGITIKSHPVTMLYAVDGERYMLNLIDTPGHVDFSYEVSRSIAACEGALLLVDASQGIEAQTVANAHMAIEQGLTIIPVINKIDLPSADPEKIKQQLEDILAIPGEDAVLASGKSGIGIKDIINAIITRIQKPRLADYGATRALIFDSIFDTYKGVICFVRVFSGTLKAGDEILMMGGNLKTVIKEVGTFSPKMRSGKDLNSGCVGYVVTNIKNVSEIKVGDTITHAENPAQEMLAGYKEVKPMVFCGVYPLDSSDHEKLKASIGKLQLNDASFTFQSESSVALGFGFRCGFLGLLHMEIVQERLRREYNLDIISTYPSVVYRVWKTSGEMLEIDNPANMPDPSVIEKIEEPMVRVSIHTPTEYIGDLLALIMEKRGKCDHTENLDAGRVMLVSDLPLNEILVDFNDRLKSITRGYGSMDYELGEYVESDLVKMDILVNAEPVDAFSLIVHRAKAESRGRVLCTKLSEVLPKQMYKVAIQAAIGGKVVARETLSAMRKDVTAKCYGGDITRKKKLLEKQKKGKERMKEIGKVSIPQDVFIRILKSE